jgi:hypothetical protein
MVDLTRTEAQMLAEIKHDAWTKRRTGVPSVKLCRVEGRTPAELFPTLTREFSSWYGNVVDEHVSYDLIAVVRKALGNAYKWGNKRDQDKLLTVTAVMTGTGCVVTISDQGKGFDVSRVVRERLFTRKGSGFTRFRKTSSVISYADGGRTLRIRFLRDTGAAKKTPGRDITATGAPVKRIHLRDLRPGDQVKVKGIPEANGNLLASTVTVKPLEDLTVIEAPLQHARAGSISLLNLNVELSEKAELVDADLTPIGFDRLRAGQDVWLTGRYVPGEGLAAIKIKIRPDQRDDYTSGLRGIIEAIDYTDGTLRAAGITIVTDSRTEVRDTRRLN